MDAPGVGTLLEIDRAYYEKGRAGSLPRVAPRHLNPQGEAWLPVLHTRFGPWHFTAHFSNSERAHQRERVYDWVVIHYSDPDGGQGRATVVTERRGSLTGRRIVRGREPECARYYRRGKRASTPPIIAPVTPVVAASCAAR